MFASLDDVTYIPIGAVASASPQGALINALPNHTDPDTVDVLSVDLTESFQLLTSAMTHADADAGRSIVLVDQELIGVGAVIPNARNWYSV